MHRPHDVRLGQAEEVVVAPQVARMGREPRPPEGGFVERVRLEHRAHGAVEHEDPLAQRRRQHGQAAGPIERDALPRGPAHPPPRARVAALEPVASEPATDPPIAIPARIRRTTSAACS